MWDLIDHSAIKHKVQIPVTFYGNEGHLFPNKLPVWCLSTQTGPMKLSNIINVCGLLTLSVSIQYMRFKNICAPSHCHEQCAITPPFEKVIQGKNDRNVISCTSDTVGCLQSLPPQMQQ
jgi:hypothetical protein